MSPKKVLSIDEGLGDALISSEIIHSQPVSAIVADKSKIYSTASDGTLVVWKKKTLAYVQTLQFSKQDIPALALDSDFIYTGSVYDDPILRVWKKKDMSLITELAGHTSSILALVCTDDYIYSGSADGTVIAWRKNDWTQQSAIDGGHQIVLSLAVDNDYIYVGGINNCTNVFRTSDGTSVTSLAGHEANVFSLATDDNFVYSGSGEIWWGGPGSPRPPSFESAVRVWDKTTWQCMAVLIGHTDNVNGIEVDTAHVFSVSDDGSLRSYCKTKHSNSFSIQLDVGVVNAIADDISTVFIGGADSRIKAIPKSFLT